MYVLFAFNNIETPYIYCPLFFLIYYIIVAAIVSYSHELMDKMAKHPILNISIFSQMYQDDKKFRQNGTRLSCIARGSRIKSFSGDEIYSTSKDAIFKMYVHDAYVD